MNYRNSNFMKKNFSPIVLFVYNRSWHTRQTVESLLANELANESDLIIFADGPKDEKDFFMVGEVRNYIKTIVGFRSVTINESPKNKGLANSVIDGVTEVVSKYGRIIVIEDDMVTSPYFLRFMNDALELYENEDKVISIHGYMYPVKEQLPETFFLRGADCWGWATWKRGWDLFEPNPHKLLNQFDRELKKKFNFNNSFPFHKMLKNQALGKIDSWAIRWYASAFIKNKLTLYPGESLLKNIGMDNSGTHCTNNDVYLINIDCKKDQNLTRVDISEDQQSKKIISSFLKKIYRMKTKKRKIKEFFKKIVPQRILNLLRTGAHTVYSGDYDSWSEARQLCSGYNQDNIVQKVAAAIGKVVAGEAVFERDSVLFHHEEYNWPLVNTLLKAARENNNELYVLDFGGSLGSTYFQNRKIFKSMNSLKWCIVEQENFVKIGIERFQTGELFFYKNIDLCLNENKINVVLLSGVLQYLEKPYVILEELKNVKADYLIIDRTFVFKERTHSRLCIQKVPPVIYKASYPIWIFGRETLENCLADKYLKIAEFDSISGQILIKKPSCEAIDKCFIFKRKPNV